MNQTNLEKVKILEKAKSDYYNTGKSNLTDTQYDTLLEELIRDGYQDSVGSPVQQGNFKKITHEIPLLSLAKTKNTEDLKKKFLDSDYIIMPKYDGLTVCLKYSGGILVEASTRGDGLVGDDITENAAMFRNIPEKVEIKSDFMLTGEAVMHKSDFEKINLTLPDEEKYKNPRNLAAGTLKSLNPEIVKSRGIYFYLFRVLKGMEFETLSEQFDRLSELGFSSYYKRLDFEIETLRKYRESFTEFNTDGLVFAFNNLKEANSKSSTSHHPGHSMAFKFEDEEAVTFLLEIEWNVGSTGAITPVAIFEPVELEGTTVSRCSVHNVKLLKELKLGLGDEIVVYKANQIIPQIKENNTKSDEAEIPKNCPDCGTELVFDYDENGTLKNLLCTNPNCRETLLALLERAVSKSCLDIKGMARSQLEELWNNNAVRNIYDLLSLPEKSEEIFSLDMFKGKRGKILIEAVEFSRNNTPLDRFLAAFCIPTIGTTVSKQIAELTKNVDTLIQYLDSGFDFTTIDGFGDIMQENLTNWYSKNSDLFAECVKLMNFAEIVPTNSNGKNVVVTGKFDMGSRDVVSMRLTEMGYNVQKAVNKETDLLIFGANVGANKTDKAKKLGIEVIAES
ncbi:MAG: NAD-dependent DNA ligase LigA, partial [Ruminococcus sp.]|nr:NAD-dependent DNA ligase LigA [Ruminococcus sp.]